ncbi:hypothetical protein M501DRAFT_184129 [Patellaria atrata CBS 101060]|uniref:K Homology domain-containing protein n=1 Tax=Patellaria atrata CBS 101060 TaxID=1346257 RepID=A0A9P4S7N1_9PEZI|nr:hypothetical protein M501DRAFT_184129 [Patellaria atrata CBS 101060]
MAPPSSTENMVSEKAAGKQKAQDVPVKNAKENVPLNTQSEESFPSLGAPKARTPTPAASMWGRKPASISTNGVNGSTNGTPASNNTSRASTPASGMFSPQSGVPSLGASQRGFGQTVSLPGRHVEHISLTPAQMKPKAQLKRPIPDTLKDITRQYKAKVDMKPGLGGAYIFEGSGNVEAVRQALKEVANQIGSKQTTKVTIPSSLRAHVIGRQGATIQNISKRTGARIQVPKQEETPSADDDDSATIDVVVEGDAVAAEMARREIEQIVNERTSTVNLRLKDIPAEYYPFLAGAHNARINALEQGRDVRVQIPHYHTWNEQAPPEHISGDRNAAQEVRAQLEREVENLRRQLIMEQMAVERGRHQFIVGERGSSLHDFLQETGCSVILPPSSGDNEFITIVGPPRNIKKAQEKIEDLAASMSMATIDVARQHGNAATGGQSHARALTRYLRQRQAIEELERLHNSSIVLPGYSDPSTNWEVYSRDGKATMRARADLMNLISGHPPTRMSNVEVDPFFHQHLQQRGAPQVREDYGVHVVFPEESDESQDLILVFEGLGEPTDYELPKKQPTAAEVRNFQRSLQDAQNHILNIINGHGELSSRELEAPPKFHEKIRRYAEREQAGLPNDAIPVQVQLSGESSRAAPRRPSGNNFAIRGPSGAVDSLAEKLRAFIEQEHKDELERGYTTSFDYPQKYANHLIGKRGENIKKLRDEFDVDIQVNDGKVEIKGPKAKADACKSHILAFARKLDDEATYVLKIKPQYHRDLIGAKGSQVNRLQERYDVRVNFPRSANNNDDADTEAGASVKNHRSQAPDEVIIKGPKRGADQAREELLSLLQYVIDNSHSATVSVAQNQIPQLIGQGGREMENLRLITGAQIDVPSARDAADDSGRAEIKIKGTKKQVEDAKKLLQERAQVFDSTVTRTLNVDKKHHKALIGAGGINIRDIVVNAGGPDDRRELARMVRFPRQDTDENVIRVEGNKDVVEKIIASIEALVRNRESQTTETLEVAPEKHRLLIGRGGETRRNLEAQLHVNLDIPKQNTTGAARSQVKITGNPSDVEKAKEHILSLVKEQEGITIDVPRYLHHTISDNGQFFRRLRNDHKVTVDHNGQQPPPKPAAASSQRNRVNGGALPLITDDTSASDDNYSWEIVDAATADGDDSTIPWVLRGSSENVAKVRSILEQALENAKKPSSTGYLILPDPKTYRLVVGPGGSQVNSIRKKTGCKITVPRDQAKGEAIEIQGVREGVEEAKDIILNLIKNGGNSGRRYS